MAIYLFALLASCAFTFSLIVPFINFLYRLKLQRQNQQTKDAFNKPTPIYDRFHSHKKGIPIGGGILIVFSTTFLFLFFLSMFAFFNRTIQTNYPSILAVVKIILFTFISFAFLGVYDDLNKIFFWERKNFFGLRLRHKLILEIILAVIISWWIIADLKIGIVHIPFVGVFELSFLYLPFASFVIVAFANAVNITDGLDGLASGVLLIALAGFWSLASSFLDSTTALFIAVWIGSLLAFLYFNLYPARIMLGDAGALSFGATFAVIGLILGKTFALPIIGGVFVAEITSSFLQLMSKKFLKRKLFSVSPLHLYFQLKGWEEPKIVMRLWLISLILMICGLMISYMK